MPLGFYYLEILDYHVGIQMNTNLHLTHLLLANHVCLIIKLKIVWLLTYWYSMENWKNKIYYLSSKKITRRSYTCPSGRLTCRARSFLSFRWEMQIMSAKKKKWGGVLVLCCVKVSLTKIVGLFFSLCYRRENLNIYDMRFKFSGSTCWVFGYKVPTC